MRHPDRNSATCRRAEIGWIALLIGVLGLVPRRGSAHARAPDGGWLRGQERGRVHRHGGLLAAGGRADAVGGDAAARAGRLLRAAGDHRHAGPARAGPAGRAGELFGYQRPLETTTKTSRAREARTAGQGGRTGAATSARADQAEGRCHRGRGAPQAVRHAGSRPGRSPPGAGQAPPQAGQAEARIGMDMLEELGFTAKPGAPGARSGQATRRMGGGDRRSDTSTRRWTRAAGAAGAGGAEGPAGWRIVHGPGPVRPASS